MTKRMWMVRAGGDAHLFNEFKTKSIIAIGWKLGDLSKITASSEIKPKVKQAYPDEKEGYISITASQISKFRFDFKNEDKIITYDPETRTYLVGEIIGEYEFDPKSEYEHIRKVKWLGDVPRDKLSTSTKNTLGAISTIFELNNEAMQEIIEQLSGKKETLPEEHKADVELDTVKENIRNSAHEFIKDQISKLNWDEAQSLVAGVLQGMGYKTRISLAGSDRGKDVIASKDSLGLEDPIFVEVKHRSGQMGSKEIRSFIAVLRPGHKGLYVSTGGFSKDAKYEAERANVPLTLIDLDELVDLIVQYYDKFDAETRALIPLTKIYWPE